MEPFLKQVAEAFLASGKELSNYCFVFPNQRAGLFFQKYLAQATSKPFLAPHITMMDEFFADQHKEIRIDDRLGLLFRLYSIYKAVKEENGKAVEEFDKFVYFGEILLSDFNDIDNYIVNAGQLYTNISDLKDLDDTSLSYLNDDQRQCLRNLFGNDGSHKEYSQRFFETWNLLATIYHRFKEDLLSNKLAYNGMLNRMAVENTQSIDTTYDKVVFIGFNAINEVQRRMFKLLGSKADFYWDYYSPIVCDKKNKSSFFMDDNLNEFKSELTIDPKKNSSGKPVINVWSIPSETAQTKVIQHLLKQPEYYNKENGTETAVILSDESLLLPVLYSIPTSIDTVNITMGYPMKQASVEQFIECCITLHNEARTDQNGHTTFFFKHVQNILKHPYVVRGDYATIQKVMQTIVSGNMIRVPVEVLTQQGYPLLDQIFNPAGDILPAINNIIGSIIENSRINKWEAELAQQAAEILMRAERLIKEWHMQLRENTLLHIIHTLLGSQSIAFKGEPLAGLQVMGMLETRCLDFRNLIITSFNEGTFPKTNRSNSFIPYGLRHSYGLPTTEHQDAIFAYHFYRLISRAEKVTLIYDSRSDGVGSSGEESRYIKQLRYLYGENKITYTLADSNKIKVPATTKTPVEKDQETVNYLKKRSYSASALNTYIKCPKQFYYRAVRKIKEPDTIEENMAANTFGDIFHKSMEELYKKHSGILQSDKLQTIYNDDKLLDEIIANSFADKNIPDCTTGRNKLVFEVIKHQIRKVIDWDRTQRAPFKFIDGEKKIECVVGNRYNLYGEIDRIDSKEGITYICDYKTGKDKIERVDIEKLFEGDNKAEFQLYFYILLYRYDKERAKSLSGENFATVLYAMRGGFETMETSPENQQLFEQYLIELLDRICDKDIPFEPTSDEKNCEFCPYSLLCK